ncbi:MAG: Calx-beta domain-containing protein [Microcystis panniformis]
MYLSASFLNTASSATIINVILEEIGHYVDAQINQVDSAGDEGAIFAELVQGNSLDVATLDALRGENDSGIITINGKIIQVEQQNLMATAGSVNQSLSFDGVDDYVSNSNVFADVSGTFTMEFWVNPTATRATTPEANSGISGIGSQRYAIHPTHGEAANLGANHFGAGVSVGTNGISVFEHTAYYLPSLLVHDTSLSGWNHVAIVYNNNTPSLYLNGQFIKTGLTSTGIVHPSIASLGGGDATGYGTFQGGLDEVRIWNTARTQTQIQNTLNSQLNGNEIGLVGYYNFNESSGNIAEDGTINNNDGQIFGVLRIDEIYSFADYIGGKYINPSTNLPNLTDYSFNKFTIDQIADGIVSDGYPYNGFASPYSSGTVTLDLVGEFNLTSFFLWNDTNVQQEGIKDFRLDFFNKSDVLIDPGFSSVYTAPLGQTAGQEYIFDKVVQGVSRVDLVVLNSQPYTFNRIEIREVGFSGEPDDDVTLPSVTLAVSPSSVTEDGTTNLIYTFTRSGVTTNALTVNYTLGGTATLNTDYTRTGTTNTVTFAANSSTATVTVDPTPDTIVEPDETVILTLAAGTGYTVGTPNAATGTITNDDISVTLAVSPSSVTEDGTTNLVYTFTRSGVTTDALTVNYTLGGTATLNTDYTRTGTTNTVTFAAGSSTATVTIDPTPDTIVESNETVILTLATGTGYTVGTPNAATGTITNDDTTVTLAVSPASVTEDGTTNLVYTFTRTGVTTNSLTVNYTLGGTATLNTDYTRTGTTNTVTFAANSSTATVTVDPTADTIVESNETVILTLATGTGYTVGTTTPVTGTITNSPVPPSITLAVSPSSVTEDGTANLVYTFTRTGVTTNALTVNYTLGGTATLNTDYTRTGTTNTVTFAANATTATVTVDPTADTIVEHNETVILTLASGTGYTVGTPNAATGTITNDDTSVTLAVSPASVTEDGTTNLVYTFTRNGVTTNPLTVNYTLGGTATLNTDYTRTGTNNTVTFAAGSSTATVTVDPTADTIVEPDETVILTLAAGTGYTVGTPNAATGTITDDDSTVTSQLSINDITVVEGQNSSAIVIGNCSRHWGGSPNCITCPRSKG